ncbi:MAG: ribonuclease HI family protein [Terracidiphilus sp.]
MEKTFQGGFGEHFWGLGEWFGRLAKEGGVSWGGLGAVRTGWEPVNWVSMTGNLFGNDALTAGGGNEWFTAHCDGGSRGNPGPSGYGAVIEDAQGRTVARLSKFLGRQTNNHAEYSGLLAVLRWAMENGARRLRVVSDSELMVKQMKGQYKVASPALKPLWEEAKQMAARLERFEMQHTLRGGNKEADQLANEAMDRGMGKPAGGLAGQRANKSASEPMSGLATQQVSGAATTAAPPASGKGTRHVLEGYVKGGVVHLLEGELPDGVFVKVIRET